MKKKVIGRRLLAFGLAGFLFLGNAKLEVMAAEALVTEEEATENTQEEMEKEEYEVRTDAVSANQVIEREDLDLSDSAAIDAWFDRECDHSFRVLAEKEEDWWNRLLPNEKFAAELFLAFFVDGDSAPEHYTFETLDEVIAKLENGLSPESFFADTRFAALELEDLYRLRETGYDLDDLFLFMEVQYQPEVYTSDLYEQYKAYKAGETALPEETVKNLQVLAELSEGMMPADYWGIAPFWTPEVGDKYASMRVSSTGIGAGGNSVTFGQHGTIYKLVVGGVNGFCGTYGASARSGYLYGNLQQESGTIGWIVQNYSHANGISYASAQISIWCLQKGIRDASYASTIAYNLVKNSTDEDKAEFVRSTVQYIMNASSGKSESYYTLEGPSGSQVAALATEPTWSAYTGETVTPPEGGEEEVPVVEPAYGSCQESVEVSYKIRVKKADWQTGVGLAGCKIAVYEDGKRIREIVTDANGEASCEVTKTASFESDYCSNYGELPPEQQALISGFTSEAEARSELEGKKAAFQNTSYTYWVEEVTAPTGYVWQKNQGTKTISGGETAVFSFANERTLGAVELVKYDNESESEIFQGDATLQGAVYGIYAAKDIVHQDKKTGVIYRKDQLVARGEIGKTPRQNAEGFLVNTDGSRHIDEPAGTLAYDDTPGRTGFGDLELGSYYIREITPSQGYLLDETVYPVTVTYRDQRVKVETRKETAAEADNKLTVDDSSNSDTVYSGEFVKKQGVEFVKTSDNGNQTELTPLEGAGFSVYLISELSGVKNGKLQPVQKQWSADDIQTFLDYDFTGEQRAVLYKRSSEPWTDGDQKWLTELGGNKYEVAEMFSDENGLIETPELPYGTYVIVETTTPEHHVAAKPFIVEIAEDSRQKLRIIDDRITKTFLRIVKADADFLEKPGASVRPEEVLRGTVFKEGAQYRLRCLTLDLSGESLTAQHWYWDGQGMLSCFDPGSKGLVGTAEKPFTTTFKKTGDKLTDCYVTLPQQLPVGTYELIEVAAPKGYVVNGSEQLVQDTGIGRVNGYEIIFCPRERVVFTIHNGTVYPDGQMGTDRYTMCDAYGNLTVTVLQENQPQKGIVKIYKHGEQLAAAEDEEPVNVSGEMLQGKTFVYEDAPVEGACFQILAAEDIYSQELDKDLLEQYELEKEEYLLYQEGDIAAIITTDRNGWGYAANLPIGRYKILETKAGEGFVLNTTETEFAITPQEQTVSFEIVETDYKNERQKLEIEVVKTDADTGKPLEGAVFGLYTTEDIFTELVYEEDVEKWVIRDTPKLLVEKGTLAVICVTNAFGKAQFATDLPLGRYEIRELQAPKGYLLSEEAVQVDASYAGEKGGQRVTVQHHCATFENQPEDKPETPSPGKPDAEKPKSPTGRTGSQPEQVAAPDTGDLQNPWLWLGIFLTVFCCGMVICFWKNRS